MICRAKILISKVVADNPPVRMLEERWREEGANYLIRATILVRVKCLEQNLIHTDWAENSLVHSHFVIKRVQMRANL